LAHPPAVDQVISHGLQINKNSYLGSGILASNTVRAELEVGLSTLNVLVVGIIQMTVDDLLGEGHGLVESVGHNKWSLPSRRTKDQRRR